MTGSAEQLAARAEAMAEKVVPTGGQTLEFIQAVRGLLPALAAALSAAAEQRDTAVRVAAEHVDRISTERDEARALLATAREAIEAAPHSGTGLQCADSTGRGPNQCDCWKRRALVTLNGGDGR